MSIRVCCNLKKLSLCFVYFHGSVRELLSFEKPKKNIFAIRLTKKNFVKHIENLPPHSSKKIVRDSLSITNIASKNYELSIIGIAQGFFEVIDYRYRFSTKGFIVPITDHALVVCLPRTQSWGSIPKKIRK